MRLHSTTDNLMSLRRTPGSGGGNERWWGKLAANYIFGHYGRILEQFDLLIESEVTTIKAAILRIVEEIILDSCSTLKLYQYCFDKYLHHYRYYNIYIYIYINHCT